MEIFVGTTFGAAVCDHFGLPKEKVENDVKVCTEKDKVFSVTLTIALTPDDLSKIADLMRGPLASLDKQLGEALRSQRSTHA